MRIIGMCVCGAGEADRYLKGTLEEFKRLCDDVIICGNNIDEKTEELIKKYGFWFYRDDREWGYEQPAIKETLLVKVAKLNPDWIIALDSDEVFAPEFIREKAEELATRTEIAYNFLIVNLYNDTEHFAHDVGIQRFWNIRYFKFLSGHTQYQRKNLHCGLAPPIYYKYGWHAPFYVEHYGLMKPEDRVRKAERYEKYDPSARFKDKVYYDDLKKELVPRVFNREKLLKQLAEAPDTQPRKTPKYDK